MKIPSTGEDAVVNNFHYKIVRSFERAKVPTTYQIMAENERWKMQFSSRCW